MIKRLNPGHYNWNYHLILLKTKHGKVKVCDLRFELTELLQGAREQALEPQVFVKLHQVVRSRRWRVDDCLAGGHVPLARRDPGHTSRWYIVVVLKLQLHVSAETLHVNLVLCRVQHVEGYL